MGQFRNGDPLTRWDAAVVLQQLPPANRARPRFAPEMMQVLETHPDPDVRQAAAHFLMFSWDRRSACCQMRVLANTSEVPEVRGQAAEALGELLCYADLRNRLNKRMVAPCIDGLRDPSPVVRFWCAFALGKSRSPRALTPLRRLLGDNEICPGWWRISDEASDAISQILGRSFPDRTPVEYASS